MPNTAHSIQHDSLECVCAVVCGLDECESVEVNRCLCRWVERGWGPNRWGRLDDELAHSTNTVYSRPLDRSSSVWLLREEHCRKLVPNIHFGGFAEHVHENVNGECTLRHPQTHIAFLIQSKYVRLSGVLEVLLRNACGVDGYVEICGRRFNSKVRCFIVHGPSLHVMLALSLVVSASLQMCVLRVKWYNKFDVHCNYRATIVILF